MGVLDRFKAKMAARQEKQRQVYENARPARLAALKKEKDLLRKQKAERNLVKQVKALKSEERREKFKPVYNFAKGLKTVGKEGAKLAKQAAARQRAGGGEAAKARQNAMFGNTDPQAALFGTSSNNALPRKTLKKKRKVIYEYE